MSDYYSDELKEKSRETENTFWRTDLDMEKINSYVIYVKSNKLSVESSKRTIKS